jgi:hypothetical protein
LHAERRLRKLLNRVDGFSVIAPITVSFDDRIDLDTVTDESVLLIDVSPGSPEFGNILPLDLTGEHFPVTLKPRSFYPYDPYKDHTDMIFPEDNAINGQKVYNYEVETDTLIIRSMYPLRPKTTYAVVLTSDLKGVDGDPIRSPFVGVNHAGQTRDLRPVLDHVKKVAFAWTFTTQSITDELELIRDGLDGEGPLKELKENYPGRFSSITDMGLDSDGDGTFAEKGIPEAERDHRYILQPAFLETVLGGITGIGFGLTFSFTSVDYLVMGTIEVPDLSDEDGTIFVDPKTQSITHKPSDATFLLTVPKETAAHKAPFPVVIYNHGARTARLELVVIADLFARYGYAMIGIDAVGHGPIGGDLEKVIAREAGDVPMSIILALFEYIGGYILDYDLQTNDMTIREVLDIYEEVGLWRALFLDGRAEDKDGDGVLLSGDGYFLSNTFQLSTAARQTIVDNLVVYRLVSRFTQEGIPGDGLDDPRTASDEDLLPYLMAGDFNADGVLDIGGPDNRYFAAGTSLGGIHTSVFLAVEPGISTGVPIVSGGGMIDITLRTRLADAVDAVLVEALGPALVGCPFVDEDEENSVIVLSWNHTSLGCRNNVTIAMSEIDRIPTPSPGARVTLRNPRLLEEGGAVYEEDAIHEVIAAEDGGFSIAVAADEGDLVELSLVGDDGTVLFEGSYPAIRDGLGLSRNTPRFRRLLQLAQIAMDRGDPLAYARHLIREPLPGLSPKNILHLADIGDNTVPFSTMVAWDRAVGLLGLATETALEVSEAFVAHDSFDGKSPYWDIDDLLNTGDGIGPLPLIETEEGVSAVRYPATDNHEYIAIPDPEASFDWTSYSRNQIIRFFETDGQEITDDLCLENHSCDWMIP